MTVKDIQHRQAATCFLAASIYGNVWASTGVHTSNDDYVRMCNGSYWQAGVLSGWLGKMIPFQF
jgi:hypothetical protein